MAIEICANL